MDNKLIFIGEILTPYKTLEDCPNNVNVQHEPCEIVVYDRFRQGLVGLERGQKILILYWLDLSQRSVGISAPFGGEGRFGTFALRTPQRPNPIGVATLEITDIVGTRIMTNSMDCLSGTKLIDIKPYV